MATGEDALCEDAAAFQIVAGPEGALLAGRAPFVPDAAGSDLLVVARDTDATCVVVHVPQGSSAVRVSDQPVVDATRQLSSVSAEGAAIDEASLWRFGSDPERSVSHLMDRGALGVACDSLGLAEAMMEATVAYTSERRQFDRPIGSFQAVKHACADMLVKVLMGRELVALGVESLVDRSAECSTAVSMAKAYTCSTAVEVVGKALQLHGGMGYTWESGIHVALKRAVLNRSLFGAPAAHRRRLAGRYATTPKAVGHI
jgi:alkylation response protein AidB-like acyl-CoA dehydrogenase